MKKLTVCELNVGERFIAPTLKDFLCNLKVERITDCSTTISGKKRDSLFDKWKPFCYSVSNSMEVIPSDEIVPDEVLDEVGQLPADEVTATIELPSASIPKPESTPETPMVETRKRREKNVINLVFPNGEFTMKDVAEASNTIPANIYAQFQELVEEGKIRFVGKRKIEGQKGKTPSFYVKNFTDAPVVNEPVIEKQEEPIIETPIATQEEPVNNEPKRKGKARTEVTLVFPNEKFSINEVAEASNINPAVARLRILELVDKGEIVFLEKVSKGKGKPTSFYAKTETLKKLLAS